MKRLSGLLLAVLSLGLTLEVLWAWPWSRDMAVQIVLHTQQRLLLPPFGSIPLGWEPPLTREVAARKLVSPLGATQENLEKGKKLYETYCLVCHGKQGRGDGPVAGGALAPTDLTRPLVQQRADGYIYATIRNGGGAMPAYHEALPPQDRWHVVLYVRTLAQK